MYIFTDKVKTAIVTPGNVVFFQQNSSQTLKHLRCTISVVICTTPDDDCLQAVRIGLKGHDRDWRHKTHRRIKHLRGKVYRSKGRHVVGTTRPVLHLPFSPIPAHLTPLSQFQCRFFFRFVEAKNAEKEKDGGEWEGQLPAAPSELSAMATKHTHLLTVHVCLEQAHNGRFPLTPEHPNSPVAHTPPCFSLWFPPFLQEYNGI